MFREFLALRKSNLKPQKANPQHWLALSIGRSNFNLSATVNTQEDRIGVEVYVSEIYAKKHFKNLLTDKASIEQEVGASLDWLELPDKEASRILLVRPDSDITDEQRWPEQHQ